MRQLVKINTSLNIQISWYSNHTTPWGLAHARAAPSSKVLCMPKVVHILRKEDLEGFKLWPCVDLETASMKWRLKQNSQILAWVLNPCLNKHTEILGNTWKITGPMNLRKFIQSFANHKAKEAKTSVSTHNKQHRFYRICSEKLLNKQGTVLTANSSNNRPGTGCWRTSDP